MSGFVYYKTNDRKICNIVVFDDGNQHLEKKFKYKNKWNIVATNNRGKVRLQNYYDDSFFVYSISLWKVKANLYI